MASTLPTFDYAQHREVLNPQFADYLEYEPHATHALCYQPRVVAAWMQTDAYTLALVRGTKKPGVSAETRARQIEVRQARRALLDSAEVHVILDEAVFWRQVDSNHPSEQVWREQIQHLREVNGRPRVTVQVLPFDRSIQRGGQGPFTVLTLPDGGQVVYREGADSESLSLDPARAAEYQQQFHRLADAAVGLEQFLADVAHRKPPVWLTKQ